MLELRRHFRDEPSAQASPEFGEAVEAYLMHELVSYRDYASSDNLSYWRSTSGFEVDFIIGDHTAVEVKAKPHVSRQDVKSLAALMEEGRLKRYLCSCLAPRRRTVEKITLLPIRQFLEELWAGAYR